MAKIYLTILVVLLWRSNAGGQEISIDSEHDKHFNALETSGLSMADMDNDGIIDTLYYDYGKHSIVCLLSSSRYNTLFFPYEPLGHGNTCLIRANDGGITISENHTRGGSYLRFIYDYNNSRFRLAKHTNEHYGGITHDGTGGSALCLLNNSFVADWNYYDHELQELFSIPMIKIEVINSPVYMDDPLWCYSMPEGELFEFHKKKHMAEYRLNHFILDSLLNTDIYIVSFEELSNNSVKDILQKYGYTMGFNLEQQYIQLVSNDLINDKENYNNRIIALPRHERYYIYLWSFNAGGSYNAGYFLLAFDIQNDSSFFQCGIMTDIIMKKRNGQFQNKQYV